MVFNGSIDDLQSFGRGSNPLVSTGSMTITYSERREMANYNFRKDLKVAKNTEKEVSELLEYWFDAKILSFNETKEYDILTEINGTKLSFEIKEDFMCTKTGNVSLETESRGKASGINSTEADFYIYKIHGKEEKVTYVIHSSSKLKRMIADKLYTREVVGGDRGSMTKNYLFKYDTFVSNGVLLPLPESITEKG